MKRIAYFLVTIAIFTTCGGNSNKENNTLKEAKGGKKYGGIFKVNLNEYIKSLYPLNIIDIYSYRVSTQVYEGLFKFNANDLSPKEAIAESYTIDESKTVYTIKLRKGIKFHDADCFEGGKGREVTAEDVKFCFTQVCTQSKNNQGFTIFDNLLKGANDYYNASAGGKKPSKEIEGIKVVDKYTIQLTLTKPYSLFTTNLARPFAYIYPKEAFEKYGEEMRIKAVGTGPFYLAKVEEGSSILLKKNPNYYAKDEQGNTLPFLDGVKISFIKDKKTEILEFDKGGLDMVVRLPTEDIIEISNKAGDSINKKFELERVPEMTTQYLNFMTQKGIFKNKNLRKAFSFAINRQEILEAVLNGEGEAPGEHGITPPVFANYDYNTIRGYEFNLDSAQYYLKKAGYEGGKGLSKIQLHISPEGERQVNVAQDVIRQLKENLNVEIEINQQPISQLIDKGLTGNFDLMRMAYYADYPSPENFLWLFWGKNVPESDKEKSYPNMPRFKNALYDEYYEKGLAATNLMEAYGYFKKAEQILMNEAAILVLWYDEIYRILKPNVKDCPNNGMQYWDFSKTYFSK
ncbi:MAG: ABC transporter substrate-binding protein [Thermonemataceae bacterium]|nr:ABC transporter substrate-binding protein [Thermonemataceae bacterium]